MGDIVVRATQPALAAIKLAWWRERLEELDSGEVPAEPRLQAVARELLPRGISGGELSELEEGWATLTSEQPDSAVVAKHGANLFGLGARLLDVSFDDATIGDAGSLFASIGAARRGLLEIEAAKGSAASMPARARPLTGLAALAARDLRRSSRLFEPEATPGRAWTLLRHRLTGRL